MDPSPSSPPSPPPSELREISPRRRRPLPLEMMMGEEFRRILVQEVESMLRRLIRQELDKKCLNYGTPFPRQLVCGAQDARYLLKFQNKISHPLHTFRKIEGAGESDVEIALFDSNKKVIVTSGPLSSIKVEVVVLNSDFNNDDRETWSKEEFNRSIALPRDNKGQLLKGERFIKLNNGVASLGNVAFTDNSSSRKTKTFRLGVKLAQSAPNGERVQEGITEPFRVKDRRVEASQKHRTPSWDDEVWRLTHIAKDGKFHVRLQSLGIKTVQDFLRSYIMDKGKLREILGSGLSESYWKEIVKHARECNPGDMLYSYCIREESTVVLFFNSIYHLVGVNFGCYYTTLDNLDAYQQDLVESWKNLAYRNINGMQFDHRMINGQPMPLPLIDVTSLPESSSLPPHISNFQIGNSDRVDSQVSLLQETSTVSDDSHDLFMWNTSRGLDIHQKEQYSSFTETSDLPSETNSQFPDLPAIHYASEGCHESQPSALGIESSKQFQPNVMDVSFGRDNSPVLIPPTQFAPTDYTVLPRIFGFEPANHDEQTTQLDFEYQAESPQFMETLRVQSSLSRMSSLDTSSFNVLIQTFKNNFPDSFGGETSSVAPPLSLGRWAKLLAPIKWVHFAKKRRARILIHQTVVATV